MRLLVTGWQGQLAQALVARAVGARDVQACAVGRPALDLCSLPTIERAMSEVRPSVVINTAAYTAVDAAESDEAAAHALNADGAGMIARVAAQKGIPIIHISTDYVYDGTKTCPYVETDPTNPVNAYGRSKLAGELAIARSNPRHLILRTCWVYSATGKNFVKTMLRLAQDRPSSVSWTTSSAARLSRLIWPTPSSGSCETCALATIVGASTTRPGTATPAGMAWHVPSSRRLVSAAARCPW